MTPLFARSSGVLLHPTSLPGRFGIGDIGPAAEAYVDWLARAKMRWWQVLPLVPVGIGHSPYASNSALACNPLLISPERLVEDRLLEAGDLATAELPSGRSVDWEPAIANKTRLLQRAFERFWRDRPQPLLGEFQSYWRDQSTWLDDHALFSALRQAHQQRTWHSWPEPLRDHRPEALANWKSTNERDVTFHVFLQFVFARQWARLRAHAAQRSIRLIGDIPMYVDLDSADLWAHRTLFRLDATGRPTVVGGVPPDYFNKNGQHWGNPIYDWAKLQESNYAWWVLRLRRALTLCDLIRLDHFRGFVSYWEIPAGAESAQAGKWVPGPGRALFDALRAALVELPLIAEDLGDITAEVTALRDALQLPGMTILQFAWNPDPPRSQFVPYAHRTHAVVYTGTHDNNTVRGWWDQEAKPAEKQFLEQYLGQPVSDPPWQLIRMALASPAEIAVVPHQDLLGLGAEARMNTPGLTEGNWAFRLEPQQIDEQVATRLATLNGIYGRA